MQGCLALAGPIFTSAFLARGLVVVVAMSTGWNIRRSGKYIGILSWVLLQILDETSAAVAALEAQQWRASTERSLEYARSLAAKSAVTLEVGRLLSMDSKCRTSFCESLGMYKDGCAMSQAAANAARHVAWRCRCCMGGLYKQQVALLY